MSEKAYYIRVAEGTLACEGYRKFVDDKGFSMYTAELVDDAIDHYIAEAIHEAEVVSTMNATGTRKSFFGGAQ